MRFQVRGDNITVTDAIKNSIEEKVSKLNKFFSEPDEITANVIVKVKGIEQIVEVTIPIKNLTLRAEQSDKDLYTAIDSVVEKLERQLRKNKTKMMSKMQKESSIIMDFNYEVKEEEETKIKIGKTKQIHMKPMDLEEAILQMELVDHPFFVFKDRDTNQIKIVYQRVVGDYGIIELDESNL